MSSFINFNNKVSSTETVYSAEVIKIALLESETKNSNKVNKIVEAIKEPITLNEALDFFTDKLRAVKSLSNAIATINEGRVKQFEMDYASMVKDIKKGYGWIDPDYVAQTWDNSSDSIDFELVRDEIFDRLIAAGLLAHADDNIQKKLVRKLNQQKNCMHLKMLRLMKLDLFLRFKKIGPRPLLKCHKRLLIGKRLKVIERLNC